MISTAEQALEFMRIVEKHYFAAPRWIRRHLRVSLGPAGQVADPDFRRWLASKNDLV